MNYDTQLHRITVLILLVIVGIISCKDSEKEITNLEIAKNYYELLNTNSVLNE